MNPMSKGSRYRKVNKERFDKNYEKIFKKKTKNKTQKH